MKLRHLEVFYAVMTCGSLTRAAEVLHISQPAASKALKHAEMRLGFALFQRIRGKLLPTDEALVLFEEAKAIHQDLDRLKALADNLSKNPKGQLSIGCLPSLGLSLVPNVSALFLQQHPEVRLNIGTHHTADLLQLLLQRDLDMGIGYDLVIEGGVSVLSLAKTPLCYIDSQPCQSPVALEDIDAKRWISPGSDSLAKLIAEHRTFAPPQISVQTYHTAAEFVKVGLGCTITDMFSASHALPESMIYPLKSPLYLTVSVLHRADRPLSKLAQNYIDVLQRYLEKRLKGINQKL